MQIICTFIVVYTFLQNLTKTNHQLSTFLKLVFFLFFLNKIKNRFLLLKNGPKLFNDLSILLPMRRVVFGAGSDAAHCPDSRRAPAVAG